MTDTETSVQPAGHPERFTTRWRLVGAGLTNVWRYGDLHLDAPSGRLLLRGPNGTGKTTALEALWPYLLDLNAQRLAAGKARPTSLALLMREGAGGAKRRCGYAWLSLAGPEDEGTFSYGVRLLFSETGSPAVRVTPFTVPGVPLRDVPLYGPDRGFLAAEQFAETVTAAGGTVFPDDEAYVAHLGSKIWRASDRDLLELATRLRAVRNPTLLGDVSPRAAADALRDALPGVSDDVVTATAEALAESDTTRKAFERDQDAAATLEVFAQAWAGHVVEVATQAYAVVNEAAGEAAKAERERREVAEALGGAQEHHAEVAEQLRAVRERVRELDATLRALEESEAYQAVGRLADLQGVVDAQNKAAAVALTAFRETVATARTRSDALRLTAEELTAELRDIADEASGVDGSAAPAELPVAYTLRAQETYLVGATAVDPGPRTAVEVEPERVDALAAVWQDLADQHRKRGDDAVLALTDRRETGEAEADAARLAVAARTLRQQADGEQRRLAQATADARAATDRLVDDLQRWYADHAHLIDASDEVPGETAVSDEERAAWRPVDLSGLEVAQVLADVERLARLVRSAGDTLSVALRHRGRVARQEAARLRTERDGLRTQARELREGKLLPLPRPAWAGPGTDEDAFARAVEWHPDVTDPAERARVETALAASGLLGATLRPDGVRTAAWAVEPAGLAVEGNLSTVLTVDPEHPYADTVAEILCRIPVREHGLPGYGLVIGRDGTFAVGPLHARPPGVDDPARLAPAEFVGARQRREAALARAAEYEANADALDAEAASQDGTAAACERSAREIGGACDAYPPRTAAIRAEAVRTAAAVRAGEASEAARTGEVDAAERAEDARMLRTEWERRTLARGLPIDVAELERLRDNGERAARRLTELTGQLRQRLRPRLVRLAADAAEDHRQRERLPAVHAEAAADADRAATLAAEHQALVRSVGLDAETALARHRDVTVERERAGREETRVGGAAEAARIEAQKLEMVLAQAEAQVAQVRPRLATVRRELRELTEVPGVAEVLFGAEPLLLAGPDLADREEGIVVAVKQALRGKRAVNRRVLRERYDGCRTELAGLWSLDPGDSFGSLDTYVLTHDGMAYTPPGAATHGQLLKQRAQAALNKAEESALRDFVIGRLPLAIGTAWVSIEDWIKDVNRKMQKAAASSGVGVRISKSLLKDLSAQELTVYRLACKENTRTAAQQAEVGEALQALIAAAEGTTMTERLANAVDVRRWLDISYEIVRPDGQISRWTSKTGLSGGERRLVVLAPMLAAVAAFYDQLDMTGLRLTALDEVPAEVDERGREGLARYIAELDLDLICTSYLWDGAPGAWDGIDAWDLEAGPDTTVVAFPMLVRGLDALPGDPL